MKFKEMLKYAPSEVVRGLSSEADYKKAYHTIYKSVQSRINTFKKHGAESYIPKSVLNVGSIKGKSQKQIQKDIMNMLNFARNPDIGTYQRSKTHKKKEIKRIKSLLESKGIKPESLTNVDDKRLSSFISDVGDMFGNAVLFSKYYNKALELYTEGERLNLNPKQFERNLAYWLEQTEELKKAKPLDRKGLKPSDYIKKLGLPRVGDYLLNDKDITSAITKRKSKTKRKKRK